MTNISIAKARIAPVISNLIGFSLLYILSYLFLSSQHKKWIEIKLYGKTSIQLKWLKTSHVGIRSVSICWCLYIFWAMKFSVLYLKGISIKLRPSVIDTHSVCTYGWGLAFSIFEILIFQVNPLESCLTFYQLTEPYQCIPCSPSTSAIFVSRFNYLKNKSFLVKTV